jgi:uncharacterized membrane protein
MKLHRRGKISFRSVRFISTALYVIMGILLGCLVGWLFAIAITLLECIFINYQLEVIKQRYEMEDEKRKLTKPL